MRPTPLITRRGKRAIRRIDSGTELPKLLLMACPRSEKR
jgi:hypothetical protein